MKLDDTLGIIIGMGDLIVGKPEQTAPIQAEPVAQAEPLVVPEEPVEAQTAQAEPIGEPQACEEPIEAPVVQEPYIQQPLPQTKWQYRPQNFTEFIGQENAKEKIQLTIDLIYKGFPKHFLLTGNAGHGKTSMAYIIAKKLNCNLATYVGSNFNIDTFKAFVKNNNNEKPNVLFIDEIAGLDKETLTYMLPVIEDFKMEGKEIRKFILIGATTDSYILSKLCQPFIDRISCRVRMADYEFEDIKQILTQYNHQVHHIEITEEEMNLLSRNSRYNPRTALSMFDYFAGCRSVEKVLHMSNIVVDGLTKIDIKILDFLNELKGKPTGIETLSIISNTTSSEFRQDIEPYMLREGLLLRSAKGRIISNKGIELLRGIGG